MMLALNLGVVAAIWFGGLQVIYGTLHGGPDHRLYQLSDPHAHVADVGEHAHDARGARSGLGGAHCGGTGQRTRGPEQADALTALCPRDGSPSRTCPSATTVTVSDPVLKDLDFVAEPGQTVALLGATGSGKSTLVHLIPRFYDVTGGRVTIDGIDVRDVDKEALRARSASLCRSRCSSRGTIRDNIRYGRPDASRERSRRCSQGSAGARLHQRVPGRLRYAAGPTRRQPVGGQKQRLAIARALLMQPTVLILDDSTSSVDVETEIKIQDALDELMRDRTSFRDRPTHQHGAGRRQDPGAGRGQIAAEGTHADLMASSAIYREIYESQLGKRTAAHVRSR